MLRLPATLRLAPAVLLRVTAPVPKALLLVVLTVPPLMVVPPLWVLAPLRVSVPPAAFTVSWSLPPIVPVMAAARLVMLKGLLPVDVKV